MTEDPLAAALSYAARRFAVLPLHSPVEGACSCGQAGCASVGKHPRSAHGLKDATTRPERIKTWWGKWPSANLGIRTGNGLVVLDVDERKGGDESLRPLGPLPDTPTVLTGNGLHLYFSGQARSAVDLLPGLDLRGDSGYVVAPPSLHRSGRRYAWEVGSGLGDLPLAPLPDAVLELLARRPARSSQRQPPLASTRATPPGRSRPGLRGASTLRPAPTGGEPGPIPEGRRNDTLARYGGGMRRLGMSAQEIEAALLVINRRCDPPLAGIEVRRVAASCARYEVVHDRKSVLARFGVLGLVPWIPCPTASLRLPVTPAQHKMIVALLGHYREADTYVSLSQQMLADELGLTRKTANAQLMDLRRLGLVATRPDPRFGDRRSTLFYCLDPTLVLVTLWAGERIPERREALRQAGAERLRRFVREVEQGRWSWAVGDAEAEPPVLAELLLAACGPPDDAAALPRAA